MAEQPHDKDWITYYDYIDHETRSIWVDEGRTFTTPTAKGSNRWVIDHGKNIYGFINWSIKGGSELENDPIHKFQPLLYPVYATGAWDIKNIIQTLGVSEVIAHTGSPRFVEEGPNQQVADVDYGTPERIAKMPAGNLLKALQPPGVDTALQNVEAMLSAQMDKATVSSILQGGDLPAGTAFATLNLVTQTAIGVLTPAKDLTQKTLAGMFEIMLEWAIHTEKPIYGFATSGTDDGKELSIDPSELETSSIYIDVELHPDSPTDKAQKVNTAGIMVQQLGLSQESALEEVGFEDPSEEMKKTIFERLVMHELDMELEQERLELANAMQVQLLVAQQELQEQAMQKQMAREQEMAKQQAEQEAAAQGGGQELPVAPGAPGEGPGPQRGAAQQGIPQQPFAQGDPGANAAGAGNPALTGSGDFPGQGGG